MNKKIIEILICLASLPVLTEARGFGGMGFTPHAAPRYYSYGSVHAVRPYITRQGVYHQQHLSGNPNSMMHCSNNVCI